jgi:hypothetical protein
MMPSASARMAPLTMAMMVMITIMIVALPGAAPYDWHCNLYCYNGGSCRHGHGKFGSYSDVGDGIPDDDASDASAEEVHQQNGMFCICPVGYTGLQCEIKFVVCSPDDHTCFNGSNCKKERAGLTGETYYRCQCDPDGSVLDAPYAGKFCEHISTVFCTGDGMEHGTSFCSNGGRVSVSECVDVNEACVLLLSAPTPTSMLPGPGT